MRRLYLVLIATSFFCTVKAQKEESKEYVKIKEELTEKIFGSADPFFKTTEIPEKYKNESVVILAQKHSIESDSKYKFRIGLFARSGVQYSFFDIFRRKLLINDKSALEEYSQFNFTKLQSKSRGVTSRETDFSFINIRVIKPDGSIKNVNVDETSVLVKEEKKATESKIAIPDLAVGDIIDYYVAGYYQERVSGTTFTAPITLAYLFGDDYPVLNYVISLQFDSRIAAEYQCINGAPDFKITPDEDGKGNIMNMAIKDIPKASGLIWTVAQRQFPIVRVRYRLGYIQKSTGRGIDPGEVVKASSANIKEVQFIMAESLNANFFNEAIYNKSYRKERSAVNDAWKKYTTQHPAANNPDSISSFVFRYVKWMHYYTGFSTSTDYNLGYLRPSAKAELISLFCNLMKLEFKTDIDFLVASGRENYSYNNIFSTSDVYLLIRVNEPVQKYFSFDDNFDFENTIPYELQGEKAKVYRISTRPVITGKALVINFKDSDSEVTLPISDYNSNSKKEIISITTDEKDIQVLNIHRTVSISGQMRKDEQAAITIYEEMAGASSAIIGQESDLEKVNSERKKGEKINETDLRNFLNKAREKHKEDFVKEIERSYSLKPKELKKYSLLNPGITEKSPFEFEENFTLEGWVKKAGNNYIVDIGKIITSQISIEKDQRERTKDIYMPFPRRFAYQIEFVIPQGYAVDGLDKLNATIDNETGAFKATAVQEGNKLLFKVEKYYTKYFYSSDKWPMLLAFLDQALDYNQQKLLLKKI